MLRLAELTCTEHTSQLCIERKEAPSWNRKSEMQWIWLEYWIEAETFPQACSVTVFVGLKGPLVVSFLEALLSVHSLEDLEWLHPLVLPNWGDNCCPKPLSNGNLSVWRVMMNKRSTVENSKYVDNSSRELHRGGYWEGTDSESLAVLGTPKYWYQQEPQS